MLGSMYKHVCLELQCWEGKQKGPWNLLSGLVESVSFRMSEINLSQEVGSDGETQPRSISNIHIPYHHHTPHTHPHTSSHRARQHTPGFLGLDIEIN